MNSITRFFQLCSGSSRTIIKRYPTESAKYAGIGATIFFTGLLAGLAGGYAVFTVFENLWIAGAFGIIWGLMIFNLDRFIVSSMRKRENKTSEWLMASPRIILAVLIAIVISRPLELKIFEKEIDNELILMQQELREEQEAAVRSRFEPSMLASAARQDSLLNQIERLEDRVEYLNREAVAEADGTGGTGLRNKGPIYRLKKAEAEKAERRLDSLTQVNDPLIAAERTKLDSIERVMVTSIDEIQSAGYDGLAARLEAMDRIKADSTAIMAAEWFILLLFIAIECAPIFVKLMSGRGPYDDRLEVHEHLSSVVRTGHMARQSSKERKEGKHLTPEEREWLEKELSRSLEK